MYSDALEVCLDDLAEFEAARVTADGQDRASGARACQRAGPREIGIGERGDMPLAEAAGMPGGR